MAPPVDINYWAVLVAAVVSMVIGALWYSPVLFGKLWMKYSGLSDKKLAEAILFSYFLNTTNPWGNWKQRSGSVCAYSITSPNDAVRCRVR